MTLAFDGTSIERTQGSGAFATYLLSIRCSLLLLISLHTAFAAAPQYRVDYRRGYMVNLGETINLTCPYTTPFYKWTTASQTSWILSEDQVYSLRADSLSASGKYICSAVNGFGHNLAEFNIKVIDKFSPSMEQSCAHLSNGLLSESGPCFLKAYTELELVETKVWGQDIELSCESVAVEGLAERLTFSWVFYPQNTEDIKATVLEKPPRDYPVSNHPAMDLAGRIQSLTAKDSVENSPQEVVSRFTGSTLRLRKLTLAQAGEYRCSVNAEPKIDDPPSVININPLTRTFRLRVQPRSEGAIIQGPHNVTATVELGRDATFSCEISEEEHRSATIRWGKYISMEETGINDFRTNEVLHWSGGTYVVLPTILPQDVKKFLDIPKPLAVSTPGSRKSTLVLRGTSPRDVGLYICSVITETGRDDHKFVHVSLRDGVQVIGGMPDVTETMPRHLTIYIAVPICVFLICICAVASLIIRNRSRHTRRRGQCSGQKSFFIAPNGATSIGKPSLNSSQRFLDHSSLTGSASMTFTRSGSPPRHGRSTVSSKVPTIAGHMQIRPSPISSIASTSTNQMAGPQFSPTHLKPSYNIYPSPATECAYISADGTPIGQAYNSPSLSSYAPPAYMGGHVPIVDYQPCPTMKAEHHPGFEPSAESSVCTTDLGYDQTGNPFMNGGGPHFNTVAPNEPNGRGFCVKDSASHVQLMQRTATVPA